MELNVFTIIAFVVYALIILGIGIYSFKKSKSVSDYFLGGRQLGSWTTAISAQASDMSGWLLMGLPGAVMVGGLTESWIAIGLFIGTYLNWLIVASRLRKMSYAAGDAITIPEYFQKRFFTESPVIRFACAAVIFFFLASFKSCNLLYLDLSDVYSTIVFVWQLLSAPRHITQVCFATISTFMYLGCRIAQRNFPISSVSFSCNCGIWL